MDENTKQTVDAKVLELFNKVKEKQKKIATNERISWFTNCSFGFNPQVINDRTNLQVCDDVNQLISFYAFILSKEECYATATEELGLKKFDKWLGYSFSDWKKDIKTRVNQLQLGNERKELKALETRLDSLITVDQRREMELAAIEKELQ